MKFTGLILTSHYGNAIEVRCDSFEQFEAIWKSGCLKIVDKSGDKSGDNGNEYPFIIIEDY